MAARGLRGSPAPGTLATEQPASERPPASRTPPAAGSGGRSPATCAPHPPRSRYQGSGPAPGIPARRGTTPGVPAPGGVPHPARRGREDREPKCHVRAQHQVVRSELAVGSRVHHDQPKQREAEGDEEQVRPQDLVNAAPRRSRRVQPRAGRTPPPLGVPRELVEACAAGESRTRRPSLRATPPQRRPPSGPRPAGRRRPSGSPQVFEDGGPGLALADDRPAAAEMGSTSEKSVSLSEPPRMRPPAPRSLPAPPRPPPGWSPWSRPRRARPPARPRPPCGAALACSRGASPDLPTARRALGYRSREERVREVVRPDGQ